MALFGILKTKETSLWTACYFSTHWFSLLIKTWSSINWSFISFNFPFSTCAPFLWLSASFGTNGQYTLLAAAHILFSPLIFHLSSWAFWSAPNMATWRSHLARAQAALELHTASLHVHTHTHSHHRTSEHERKKAQFQTALGLAACKLRCPGWNTEMPVSHIMVPKFNNQLQSCL